MIEVTNIKISNFEGAFRGLRNPMNSWNKSDSFFGLTYLDYLGDNAVKVIDKWIDNENKKRIKDGKPQILNNTNEYFDIFDKYEKWLINTGVLTTDNDVSEVAFLGPNDLDLAQRMIKGGPEEAKFLRQIFVSMDINTAIFHWKEIDTYKVGTTANSCSTMHTIHKTPITKELFSFSNPNSKAAQNIINNCEKLRQVFVETKDKQYWRELIELLPMSFNQKRTWTANYQVLRNIYFQRRNHKLKEWHTFCEIIENLPYGKELICYTGE